jgi:tetratricopeptide (TPR) repeat protein
MSWEENELYDEGVEVLLTDASAAVPLLEAALELQPDRPRIHVNLGWALSNLGEHDAAKASAERARELDPKDAYVAARRVHILFAAGDADAVIQAAEDASTLADMEEDDHRDVRTMLCWMLMRVSPTAAVAVADALALEWPTHAEVLAAKGCALAAACRWDEGIVCLDEAIAADPEDARYPRRREQIEQVRDLATVAMSDLREAAEEEPEDANRWRELGLALAKFARLEEALAAFERASALDPEEDPSDPLVMSAMMVEATARPAVLIGNMDPIG